MNFVVGVLALVNIANRLFLLHTRATSRAGAVAGIMLATSGLVLHLFSFLFFLFGFPLLGVVENLILEWGKLCQMVYTGKVADSIRVVFNSVFEPTPRPRLCERFLPCQRPRKSPERALR